jgi:hypothetical protein
MAVKLNSFTHVRALLVVHDRGILAHVTSDTGQFPYVRPKGTPRLTWPSAAGCSRRAHSPWWWRREYTQGLDQSDIERRAHSHLGGGSEAGPELHHAGHLAREHLAEVRRRATCAGGATPTSTSCATTVTSASCHKRVISMSCQQSHKHVMPTMSQARHVLPLSREGDPTG